jgi:predicted outer membrane repeat protein
LIQVFAESATSNVTISNVTVNGTIQDTETVRAIEVIANPIDTSTVPMLTIESSTIQNSHGDSNGGAVLTPGDITVSNSTFTNNSAEESGGAIYTGGKIDVDKSTFTNNTAGDSGGAIATHSSETVTITNSQFQTNEAAGISDSSYAGGGAIKGGEGLLQVDGSKFSENTSDLHGGAILHFGDLEVTDSVFEENEARFIDYGGEGSQDGSGGAIFAISEDETELVSVSINSSSFLENTAAGDGGAVRVLGRIEVSESSFSYNSAAGAGGAIDIEDSRDISGEETTSRISSSDFISNETTEGDGGAIDGSGYVLVVEESNFVNNYAGDDGGAIWSGGLVRVLHSDFSGNTAEEDGGAIDADSVQINQSQFLDNEALYDGGAIHVQNDESENILSAILNTKFDANKSISGQGNALHGNAWLLLNSFVNYRTRDNVSAIALETNFGSVSIGNSFAEQNADVVGDGFCTLGFDYSANNYATDSSCFGNFELDPVKSKVASSSVDSDGSLAFSDDIFNGDTGILAFDADDQDLLSAFINTARGRLNSSSFGPLPTDAQAQTYENSLARWEADLQACDANWYSGCHYDANSLHYSVEEPYLETFGAVLALNLIVEDAKDLEGHQFIEDYLSVDYDDFNRAEISTWTAGAVHLELKPVVVSNSNTSISIRSVSRTESNIFTSLEDQKIRAEKAALADAERKAAKSLRVAEIEKRKALTAQMRAKIAQTQVRGEMLKLKKQWQNLMKNFIW